MDKIIRDYLSELGKKGFYKKLVEKHGEEKAKLHMKKLSARGGKVSGIVRRQKLAKKKDGE